MKDFFGSQRWFLVAGFSNAMFAGMNANRHDWFYFAMNFTAAFWCFACADDGVRKWAKK